MRVAVFDSHGFEKGIFELENKRFNFDLTFFDVRLNEQSAKLVRGHDVVCSFVNDRLNSVILHRVKELGVKLIALRSAGFNHVDLAAAETLALPVVRVPEYSPYAVAEHAVALMLTLNRKIHRSFNRVRELNFSLEGLVGFDMHLKTAGIVGLGKIGSVLARIMRGFGCRVLGYDLKFNSTSSRAAGPSMESDVEFVSLEELYRQSDVISLHVPLTPQTRHMIDRKALSVMKKNVLLINTGRGALIDTAALIEALKVHQIGGAGLDVYEEEEGVFFEDHSTDGINDDLLARLLTFPNVLITSHQGFLTQEALQNIAETTLQSISQFARGEPLTYRVQKNAAR